jgi:hypothetical protein
MEKTELSGKACELLFEQIATAQAEILKNETLISQVKKAIYLSKKSMVEELINGKVFKIENRQYVALDFHSYQQDNGDMNFTIYFGLDPHQAVQLKPKNLGREEKILLSQYTELYDLCKKGRCMNGYEAVSVCEELYKQKHHFLLYRVCDWEVKLEKGQCKGFFNGPCLSVPVKQEDGIKQVPLEDLVYTSGDYDDVCVL